MEGRCKECAMDKKFLRTEILYKAQTLIVSTRTRAKRAWKDAGRAGATTLFAISSRPPQLGTIVEFEDGNILVGVKTSTSSSERWPSVLDGKQPLFGKSTFGKP